MISLGSGDDTFTINSTHGAATGPTQEETILNTGAGTDTVHINDVTDLLFVNGQADADTINVNGTGAGSISTLNGDAGNDVFNVHAMNGTVNVNGGADNDTVNVGSDAPTLPTVPTNQVGTIDSINGLLTVNGGTGTDVLNVDDLDPAVTDKTGTLTASTLRGLALEQGIDYSQLETLNIWLATGDNTFNITSTHGGSTIVNTAEGAGHRQHKRCERLADGERRGRCRHDQRERHRPGQPDLHQRPGRRRHRQRARHQRRHDGQRRRLARTRSTSAATLPGSSATRTTTRAATSTASAQC